MDKNALDAHDKFLELKAYLKSLGSIAVAFSGGVDSVFLLKAAWDVLGNHVTAITAKPCSFPDRELREAETYCREMGIRHIVFHLKETEIDGFCENPPNRCYLCKKQLFSRMLGIAAKENIPYVAEGSNMDDAGDYRPGMAAVAELGILSPLRQVKLYKEEIRKLSKELGLRTWQKPSFACLSSRFAYGERITEEKLAMVEKAEELLFDRGFRQARVRVHSRMARIEVLPEEIERLAAVDVRNEIVEKLKSYGFTYVSMDLQGYRTGSMNEALQDNDFKNQQ